MVTISLCMIIKDEEAVLERCLESVREAVDEIIIVDTGSTDSSIEIAKKFTDKVYNFKWVHHFAKARNYAFSKATMDYQMWLDADDILETGDLEKLIKLKKTLDPSVDIVTMRYNTHFDDNGVPVMTTTRERLFKREKNFQWQDAVHECIPISGKVQAEEIYVTHKKLKANPPGRNLIIYENMIKNNEEFSPRQTYYYARELMDNRIYDMAAKSFNEFLESKKGWSEDNIASCYKLSQCYEQLGQKEKILPILFKSFEFDVPRAEICAQIGYYFRNKEEFKKAIYWFELCLTLKKGSHGFILNEYWDFIPPIELCYCYSKLGVLDKSYKYNQLAKKAKPHSKSVMHNEEWFKSINYPKDKNI